ncbi:MAG TPA: TetR/AcrR family transcriptional regulator [Microvirga sp.]|nr:TetR/AcrR family transcriptional regulator [Microvirga sp.]
MTPTRRSRPRGEVRRTQLVEIAAQVFLENGYGGTTIDLVAARAEASKATIYSFFGDKQALFATIVQDRTERILSAFLDIEPARRDVQAALVHIARRYLEIVLAPEAVGLYRLIIAEGARFPDVAETFYHCGPKRISEHFADILGQWRERGLIALDDPALTAAQFLEGVRGDLHLRVMAGLAPQDLDAAVEYRVQNIVRTLWNGIRPEATSS